MLEKLKVNKFRLIGEGRRMGGHEPKQPISMKEIGGSAICLVDEEKEVKFFIIFLNWNVKHSRTSL